jgi:hypothetical protein
MNRLPTKGSTQKEKSHSQQSIRVTADTIPIEKKFAKFDDYICIPMSIDKKPVVSWKNIKKTPEHMFNDDHNIALITGKINGITVVDIDVPKPNKSELDGMNLIIDLFQKHNNGKGLNVPTCTTQSGGLHLYFKYDPDIKTSTGLNGYSIDVRNDNALIIVPPSIGIKGQYLWMDDMSLHDTDLTEIPAWLKEWLLLSTIKKTTTKISVKENRHVYQINKEYVYIYDKTKIVDLLNKLPNKYLDNYNSWFIVTSCLKSEGLFDVWNEWSKNGKNYDKDNNVKKEMDIVVERLKKYCEDNKLTRQLNNFMVYSSAEGDDNDFLHINDRWKNK